jgi:hypothetical protein
MHVALHANEKRNDLHLIFSKNSRGKPQVVNICFNKEKQKKKVFVRNKRRAK